MAVDGTLKPESGSVQTSLLTIRNSLSIPIMMYVITGSGQLGGWNSKGALTVGFPAALLKPNATVTTSMWNTGWYALFLTAYSGAFVTAQPMPVPGAVLSAGATLAITQDMLADPNNIGNIPTPSPDVIIPRDSTRVLVGCGQTPAGTTVTREQYWHLTPDSYSMSPGQTRTIGNTVTTGLQETTSSMETVAKSLGVSVSGGWGPVSASISASLSKSTSTFQQLSLSSQTSSYTSDTVENKDTVNPAMFLLWQMTEVITVFDSNGQPLSSVVLGGQPLITLGPYNLNALPTPSDDELQLTDSRDALSAMGGQTPQLTLDSLVHAVPPPDDLENAAAVISQPRPSSSVPISLAWGPEQLIASEQLQSDPALIAFGGDLLCFQVTGQIYASSSPDGVSWQSSSATGLQNGQAVAVGTLVDTLYCLGIDAEGGTVSCVSSTDGAGWSAPSTVWAVVNAASDVALVEFDEMLYCAYQQGSSDQNPAGEVWQAATADGTNWRPIRRIPGVEALGTLSLAVYEDRLYCVYPAAPGGPSGAQLWFTSSADGMAWLPPQPIPGATTQADPSVAVYQDQLVCGYSGVGGSSGQLWYVASPDGLAWQPPQQVPDVTMQGGPSLAVFGGNLYFAYRSGASVECIYATESQWPPVPGESER